MSSKDPSAFGLSLPASLAGYGSFALGAEATEDVVQEVFLQLFRHLQLGRSRASLRGWIFRVGHNLALKQRAKVTRRQKTESAWDATLADFLADPGANPEQQLVEDRRGRRLRVGAAGTS
jgi:RNA polymerase sigma-70 factor, ECF subfamily